LAIAVRERLPEHKDDRAAFFKVFLDDHEKFDTRTFVEACRRLETKSDWFPKKAELFSECVSVARAKHEQMEAAHRARYLPPEPVDPDKLAAFMEKLKAFTRGVRLW